jgi:hypothetical protein
VRQIYALKIDGRTLSIHVGIDGLRLVAARTGRYAGQVGPYWCGADGVWHDVWLANEAPAAAKVGILVKGNPEPVWGIAMFREFVRKKDGRPNSMWSAMPANMLAKCAEAQALKKALPNDLANLTPAFEDEPAPAPVRTARIHEEPMSRLLPAPQLSEGDGPDLEMRPAPGGAAPKTELETARGFLGAAYNEACTAVGVDYRNREERIRVTNQILGPEHEHASWTKLSAAQCRTCAHHLKEHGFPREETTQDEALELDAEPEE